MRRPLRAAALTRGDRVAIVAPSSPVLSRGRLDDGIEILRRWGLEPLALGGLRRAHGHLAGTDDERADDLNTAFRDPTVRAVVAARGGYGVTRILDRLDWDALAADPKLLVGFSDVSALLLAAWRRVGLVSVHGQFAGRLSLQPDPTLELLRRLVLDPRPLGALTQPAGGPPLRTVVAGEAEGPLVGGNLSLVATLVGTPDQPDTDGAIVFLEDVAEAPYRIDRMLTQLRRAGLFDQATGVIVGELRDCEPSEDRPSLTTAEVVDEVLGDLGVPVLEGLAIGHVDRQLPLPVGVRARLDVDAGGLTVLEAATTPAGC